MLYADIEEPERCTIRVSGRGDKGTIDGQGEIELREAGGDATEVAYRGEFKITGPVAGVGQRLAPGVSRKMIVETLRNLEKNGESEHGGGGAEYRTPGSAGEDDREPTPSPGDAAKRRRFLLMRLKRSIPCRDGAAGGAAPVGLVVGFLIGRRMKSFTM